MIKFLNFIDDYRKIEKPILYIIISEFFIQLVNATFINVLPIYMKELNYSNEYVALYTTFRYLGVFLLALPFGYFLKKRKLIPLFYISNIFLPIFGVLVVACIFFKLEWLSYVALFLWGSSFTFMQIPISPFILRNCKKQNHTAAISLSYTTWSFGALISGVIITVLQFIDKDLFNSQFILLLFSFVGLGGIYFLLKTKTFTEILENGYQEKTAKSNPVKERTDWLLIIKALIPTLIIATGAGLTIPFISLFFHEVHNLSIGQFSILSSIAALLVIYGALMVPKIKKYIGYKIAIPTSQSLAVISLVALATTQYYNQFPIAVVIAAVCYLLRQPLMNMAGPMTTELVLNYVGPNNREVTSGLTSAIWSGSWVVIGYIVKILFAYHFAFVNIFLITSLLYAFGVIMYYLLILDFNKREKLGLIK